jgi:hypothetical protein
MKRIAAALLASIGMMFVAVPAEAVPESYGYDVSWPQCSNVGSLPTDGSFEVIGVNNGIVYSTNPCLQQQLTWAGQDAELYLNTGNPGPNLSARYTSGSVAGKTCYSSNKNSTACAFLYGYRAARDSYERAQAAFASLSWTSLNERTWWLDVERVNSWRGLDGNLPSDNFLTSAQARALNVANIQGSVYYLESVAMVQRLGIYSVTSHWAAITGASKSFSDHETWMAVGLDGEQAAISQCLTQPGFTGAPETRVQYIDSLTNLDVNVPCAFEKTSSTTTYSGTKSVARNRTMTLKATLKTSLGTAMANQLVSVTFNRKTYSLKTNSNGVASKTITSPKYRGNYKVTLSFPGNEIIASSSKESYVKLY